MIAHLLPLLAQATDPTAPIPTPELVVKPVVPELILLGRGVSSACSTRPSRAGAIASCTCAIALVGLVAAASPR